MTGTRWALVVGALALTTTAEAQGSGAEAQGARARCADPCEACLQRINGSGSSAGDACPSNSCTLCDQQRQSRAQAGQASGQPATGSDVRTSLDQTGQNISNAVQGATNDLRGLAQMQQQRRFGAGGLQNTLITDAIGTFTGEGLNLEYQRPIAERVSGVVGANYSRTTSTTGSLTAFGGEAGVDFFPFSYAGTGLRIGPRLGLSLGQESVDNSRFFTDFGLGGELGYNWVGSSGLSLQGALGLGGRVGGALTSGLDTRLGGDFGPYAKVNVGWSW